MMFDYRLLALYLRLRLAGLLESEKWLFKLINHFLSVWIKFQKLFWKKPPHIGVQ